MQLSKQSVAVAVILVILLILVRVFEKSLFYDPLLAFFKTEDKVLPDYNAAKLYLSLAARYMLNMALSLGIIYVLFRDKSILKVCLYLYLAIFAGLMLAFFLVINAGQVNLLALFYIRRFLIQPLFLLLFVPAFYYQKRTN